MTTLRDAFRLALEGDTAFATPLTGGIYDASELPPEFLTPSQTPSAWDSDGILKPCAVIRWRNEQPFGPHFHSERTFAEVYVYQVSGTAIVEAAILRAKNLLHRSQLTATDYGLRWLNWVGGGDVPAPELGNA